MTYYFVPKSFFRSVEQAHHIKFTLDGCAIKETTMCEQFMSEFHLLGAPKGSIVWMVPAPEKIENCISHLIEAVELNRVITAAILLAGGKESHEPRRKLLLHPKTISIECLCSDPDDWRFMMDQHREPTPVNGILPFRPTTLIWMSQIPRVHEHPFVVCREYPPIGDV